MQYNIFFSVCLLNLASHLNRVIAVSKQLHAMTCDKKTPDIDEIVENMVTLKKEIIATVNENEFVAVAHEKQASE